MGNKVCEVTDERLELTEGDGCKREWLTTVLAEVEVLR